MIEAAGRERPALEENAALMSGRDHADGNDRGGAGARRQRELGGRGEEELVVFASVEGLFGEIGGDLSADLRFETQAAEVERQAVA